jgi:hypothetical protein
MDATKKATTVEKPLFWLIGSSSGIASVFWDVSVRAFAARSHPKIQHSSPRRVPGQAGKYQRALIQMRFFCVQYTYQLVMFEQSTVFLHKKKPFDSPTRFWRAELGKSYYMQRNIKCKFFNGLSSHLSIEMRL